MIRMGLVAWMVVSLAATSSGCTIPVNSEAKYHCNVGRKLFLEGKTLEAIPEIQAAVDKAPK